MKTPRAPTRDDGTPGGDGRSRLYHLYQEKEVREDFNRRADATEPLPDLVRNAYEILGSSWLEKFGHWRRGGGVVPPVMITVANRIETAARINHAFARRDLAVDAELCKPHRLLHIDSKAMRDAERRDEGLRMDAAADSGMNLRQKAERLRLQVGTVGQEGRPGEQISNVISVSMLSEGWDARNVTHIMGLRAFSSQLLCEQVVGRGLRRTSYDLDDDGLFRPEYVEVVGVPFSFLPHEGSDPGPLPDKPATRIEPLPERRHHAIKWPNVVRIEYKYRPVLELDWGQVEPLTIDPTGSITEAQMDAIVAGKPHDAVREYMGMGRIARGTRLQTIIFQAARTTFDRRKFAKWRGGTHSFLSRLIPLVERFIQSGSLQFRGGIGDDEYRRQKVLIMLHIGEIIGHLWGHIRDASIEDEPAIVVDQEHPILATGGMRPWYTRRPCASADKSHISHCVYDSGWEASEAYQLDRSAHVQSFARNDHLGFAIHYNHRGATRKYYPDFLIRLTGGDHLVLEVKGQRQRTGAEKAQTSGGMVQGRQQRWRLWPLALRRIFQPRRPAGHPRQTQQRRHGGVAAGLPCGRRQRTICARLISGDSYVCKDCWRIPRSLQLAG